jgi:Protein of unknown function (DUF2946)
MGAWLGILALLVQLVVSALPMPAEASTGIDHDLSRICSTHQGEAKPDRAPQSPHQHTHCPVCAAAYAGTNTLPPPVGVFIGHDPVGFVAARIDDFSRLIASGGASSHQPRGPPTTS